MVSNIIYYIEKALNYYLSVVSKNIFVRKHGFKRGLYRYYSAKSVMRVSDIADNILLYSNMFSNAGSVKRSDIEAFEETLSVSKRYLDMSKNVDL